MSSEHILHQFPDPPTKANMTMKELEDKHIMKFLQETYRRWIKSSYMQSDIMEDA